MKIKVDCSQLEKLSDNIAKAVSSNNKSRDSYNPDVLLRSGAKVVMESVLHNTPIGENGSNWWGQDRYYGMDAHAHRAGTLRRGWITDSTIPGATESGGAATTQDMRQKVERTEVVRAGTRRSMTFINRTPYAADVEWGHVVVFGKDGVERGYVGGKYYTRDGVGNSTSRMRKTVKHELNKQMKKVFQV